MALDGTAARLRQAAGLSLKEVAGPVGVTVTSVYRWEKGLRAPRGEAAIRYLRVLDALAKVVDAR
ncbi:hypothetical protein SCMU_19270 [Sinomonas cyclohexanicum]|uniref:HTH cro/C1-type domain-containing protein n=2 Tax=Sinomonas cyclohexanicum TaxID=322009 RepID=A0ABN6FHN5_SINCY|nr:hypothetical protein SCMU_19270 [Corynebacterium cyclohexanicum]